ncbi:hypothetical protein O9992_18170 [Vibrio lentus]|nr:hypothetical protein [Vibrio lentus]
MRSACKSSNFIGLRQASALLRHVLPPAAAFSANKLFVLQYG